jgi:hypothetical protein
MSNVRAEKQKAMRKEKKGRIERSRRKRGSEDSERR